MSCKQHATEVIFGFLEIKYTSASNMAIDCVRFCVVLFDNENGYTKDRKVFHVYGKCKILLTIVRYTCIFSKIDLYVDSCLVDLVHLQHWKHDAVFILLTNTCSNLLENYYRNRLYIYIYKYIIYFRNPSFTKRFDHFLCNVLCTVVSMN